MCVLCFWVNVFSLLQNTLYRLKILFIVGFSIDARYWTTFYHQYLDKKPDPIYFYLYKDLKINTFKKIKGNTVYYHHFVWLSDSQTRSSSIFEFYLRCLWTWNRGDRSKEWHLIESHLFLSMQSLSSISWYIILWIHFSLYYPLDDLKCIYHSYLLKLVFGKICLQ